MWVLQAGEPATGWGAAEWGVVGFVLAGLVALVWYLIRNGRADTLAAIAEAQRAQERFVAYVEQSARQQVETLTAVANSQARLVERMDQNEARDQKRHEETLAALRAVCHANGATPPGGHPAP
jgi:uncharacterized protein (UPF0333 family)